jgi:hypothetical protein
MFQFMARSGQENLAQGLPSSRLSGLLARFRHSPGLFCSCFRWKSAEALRSPTHALSQSQWHKRCSPSKRSAATGIDKRPQLDWRGSSLQDKGFLQLQTRGNQSSCTFPAVAVNPAGIKDPLYVPL